MSTPPPRLADVLGHQVARLGDRPLLTYYDTSTGERTELGYATFANWAAKAANLLADRGAAPGDDVVVAVDGHWSALVVAAGCGLFGARAVLIDGAPVERPAALVVAHERYRAPGAAPQAAHERYRAPGAAPLLVGEGLGGRLTGSDGEEFVAEALACDDDFDDPDVGAGDEWLVLPDGSVRTQEAALTDGPDLPGDRVLFTVPVEAALPLAVSALAAGKSFVLVRGGDQEAWSRIGADERCDSTAPASG